MASPVLSVIICTHNRAPDVRDCLEALHPQLERTDTELILVDSASNAAHRAELEALAAQFTRVNLVTMAEPGLSAARNAGMATARGAWLAFVDDDAVPAPDWHDSLQAVLVGAAADWGAIGGRILPRYPAALPAPEIGSRWKVYLSLNERTGARDCSDRFELIAANSCFRKLALQGVDGFPAKLGREKGSLLSGEDVYVMLRLRQAGWRIRYDGSFWVWHKIPAERLTRRWVHARAFWEGVTTMRLKGLMHDRRRFTLLMKALVMTPAVGLLSLMVGGGAEWDLRFWFDYGLLFEGFRFGRDDVRS